MKPTNSPRAPTAATIIGECNLNSGMSATFLDRVPSFKHNVTREMKKEILKFRAELQGNPSQQPPIIKLPLPEKIEDDKKIEVAFPATLMLTQTVRVY